MKKIYGIRKYTVQNAIKSYWTQIGTALVNKDGSLSLIFDYIPANHEIRIQVREDRQENDN